VAHIDDQSIAQRMLDLLRARDATRSVCPSEVARALAPEAPRWRALMPVVRRVAGQLAGEGVIEVTQQGRRIEIARAAGPVRLRRGPAFPAR
jgi:hypothetical protein